MSLAAGITYEGPAGLDHHARSALLHRIKAQNSRFPGVVGCIRQTLSQPCDTAPVVQYISTHKLSTLLSFHDMVRKRFISRVDYDHSRFE